MQKLKGELMLFLAAVIRGISFLFQKVGMEYIGPLTFTMFRFGIGSLATIRPAIGMLTMLEKTAPAFLKASVTLPLTEKPGCAG